MTLPPLSSLTTLSLDAPGCSTPPPSPRSAGTTTAGLSPASINFGLLFGFLPLFRVAARRCLSSIHRSSSRHSQPLASQCDAAAAGTICRSIFCVRSSFSRPPPPPHSLSLRFNRSLVCVLFRRCVCTHGAMSRRPQPFMSCVALSAGPAADGQLGRHGSGPRERPHVVRDGGNKQHPKVCGRRHVWVLWFWVPFLFSRLLVRLLRVPAGFEFRFPRRPRREVCS